jgi:DNA primase
MNKRIPQQFIDEILTRIDIVEIINARIQLRKTGSNFSGLCPFHTEKTPSFTVSPTKQFFYCFGCGSHGNAIGFLMQYEKLEFLDVIENLAARCGLELPHEVENTKEVAQLPLYKILDQVTLFYQKQLRLNKTAIDYLKSRGLTGQIAKQFNIGYANSEWENLQQFCKTSQDRESLIASGMLIQKPDGHIHARFRARIMFPIRDIRGRVIGFGGRTLGNENPKYLNSPETPLFHKSQELYGLYEARKANNSLKKVLVVEGYMDVIALAQYEINYAVATLGTATSNKHIQRLLRYTSEIIFCFDGDAAGYQAGWRALEIALPLMRDGIQMSFMFLPEKEDPDSLVRKEGKDLFEMRINNAIPLSDYFFNHLTAQTNTKTADGKARLVKNSLHLLDKLPQGVFRELMLQKLASLVGIGVDKLTLNQEVTEIKPLAKPSYKSLTQSPITWTIILLLRYPQLITYLKNISSFEQVSLPHMNLLLQLTKLLQQEPQITPAAIFASWPDAESKSELAKLAMKECILSIEEALSELQGALLRIDNIAKETIIQSLFTKAKEIGLSVEEKLRLQTLLAEKTKN